MWVAETDGKNLVTLSGAWVAETDGKNFVTLSGTWVADTLSRVWVADLRLGCGLRKLVVKT